MLKVVIRYINLRNSDKISELLSNINFEIPEKNVYTIIGKNGSGKTTLIKSLTSLLDEKVYSSNYTVEFHGANLKDIDKQDILEIRESKIKYVFQDPVNSFDPLRKLSYYFRRYETQVDRIDELFSYFRLPKYKEIKKLHNYKISTGMAQRLIFILALLANPNLIIMDEPTSAIDPPIAELYSEKIKHFAAQPNRAILLVTQDLKFAEEVSDKIAFLNGGSLTNFQTPKEFFENPPDIPELKNFINAHKELTE